MDFMEWAHQFATMHPSLAGALVSSHGEWLDVLLSDGRTFRFRPGSMIKADAPLEVRQALLSRLIDIGISQAKEPQVSEDSLDRGDNPDDAGAPGARGPHSPPVLGFGGARNHPGHPANFSGDETDASASADEDEITPSTPIVPIVRAADYFINPSTQADPLVHVPLTDFVAVGLAYDLPNSIHPVYYSGLSDDDRPIGEILAESVVTLRHLTGSARHRGNRDH